MSKVLRIGDRFNRLVIIGDRVKGTKGVPAYYPVRCDCGKEGKADASPLARGLRKSCGCLRREGVSALAKSREKHGGTRIGQRSPLYGVWMGMRRRCQDRNSPAYPLYGGRGITVCEEWQSFATFREWAEANGYVKHLDIDRRDNNRGYSPDNCRWVTRKVNSRNTRRNRFLTAFGETKTLEEWTEDERCRVHRETIRRRLARGWADEDAISTVSSTC
jgi:hypothetical protein